LHFENNFNCCYSVFAALGSVGIAGKALHVFGVSLPKDQQIGHSSFSGLSEGI
jgi:hypothetical protein